MGALREASFGYMNNIKLLGEDDNKFVVSDQICRAFEAVYGAMLIGNRKNGGAWLGFLGWGP
jgi:hypothetical protein